MKTLFFPDVHVYNGCINFLRITFRKGHPMNRILSAFRRLNSFQIIVLGFAFVILLGAGILMLPVSSVDGVWTPFVNALFTAVTSVCVTGLVVCDTGTYWSSFGHAVILILIQIGGLGVVTISASFSILSGKKIGLSQRSMMAESVSAPQLSGIVRLTGFVVKTALGIELIGALLMAPVFCRDFGFGKGLWMSLFHSISAFCNAGIDLMGIRGEYSSLTSYAYDPLINLVIMLLIVIGGIGFLTWDDIYKNRHHFSRYRMQSKVILSFSLALILIPAVLFFFLEFQDVPAGKRILLSLFQSVTTRTAGFNTADISSMRESGQLLMVLLMLVGGSPGSTAGGIKTTTLAVLIACATAVFERKDSPELFRRRIVPDIVATAIAIFFMYTSLGIICAMTLSILENLPIIPCLFEAFSALATVGLSFGITPTLSVPSKLILIAFMFIGRVGGLTIIYATMSGYRLQCGKFPQEKISVG